MKPKTLIPVICIALNIATAYADLPIGGGGDTGGSGLTCISCAIRHNWDTWKQCSSTIWEVEKYETGTQAAYPDCSCTVTETKFRCAAGYYGNATNKGTACETVTGCRKCPDGGTSKAGANTLITSCYIPANTEISDDTGTYIYTEDCKYTNKIISN